MPIRGDFDKLQALQRGLAIAGERGARACAEKAADEALKLARGQVRRAEDPDGNAWAPLVQRVTNREAIRQQRQVDRGITPRAGRKPLATVGSDATAAVDGSTAHVELPHKGARFANTGTRREAQRQIVPIAGLPMPDRWRRRILSRTTFIIWRLIKQQPHPEEGSDGSDR